MKVAIVIPVYNGRQHLPDLLSSLEKYTLSSSRLKRSGTERSQQGEEKDRVRSLDKSRLQSNRGYSTSSGLGMTIESEIIVVDDNSTDGSVEFIKKEFPGIRLMQNQKNLGYAGNVNRGLKHTQNSFDFTVVLNQDIVVSKNWLDPLVEAMENDSQIAAAQPLVMYPPSPPTSHKASRDKKASEGHRLGDEEKVQTWGNEIHFLMFGFSGGNLENINDFPRRHPGGRRPIGYRDPIATLQNDSREITYTTGSAMIIRNSILKQIGLLDEDLVMYHEDLEWCLRARAQGYKMALVPEARVYHKYDFEKSMKKYFYMERNRFIVFFQYYKFLTILFVLPPLILMEVAVMAFSFLRGFWLQRLQAYMWLVIHWPKVFAKRQETQHLRKIKDRELMKTFVGKIEYQEIDNPILKYIGNPIMNAYWQVLKRIMWW